MNSWKFYFLIFLVAALLVGGAVVLVVHLRGLDFPDGSGPFLDSADAQSDSHLPANTPQQDPGSMIGELKKISCRVHQAGAPVFAARVTLLDLDGVVHRSGATPANGLVEFKPVNAGMYIPCVEVSGTAHMLNPAYIDTGEAARFDFDLLSVPSGSLVGVVVDRDGLLIADAEISLLQMGEAAEARHRKSDISGNFGFENVKSRVCAVAAVTHRHGTAMRAPVACGSRIVLVLRGGGSFTGRFLDAESKAPVSRFRLFAFPVEAAGGLPASLPAEQCLRMNWRQGILKSNVVESPDGLFELPALPPASRFILFGEMTQPPFASYLWGDLPGGSAPPPPGEAQEFMAQSWFEFPPCILIDHANKLPVGGALLQALLGSHTEQWDISSADGRVHASLGPWSLLVTHDDYAPRLVDNHSWQELLLMQPEQLSIELDVGVEVSGVLQTASGKGIPGATILLLNDAEHGRDVWLQHTGITGTDGDFTVGRLSRLENSDRYRIVASFTQGLQTVELEKPFELSHADFTPRKITLALAAGHALEGAVYDPAGPVAGAKVLLFAEQADPRYYSETYTNAEGEFRFSWVPASVPFHVYVPEREFETLVTAGVVGASPMRLSVSPCANVVDEAPVPVSQTVLVTGLVHVPESWPALASLTAIKLSGMSEASCREGDYELALPRNERAVLAFDFEGALVFKTMEARTDERSEYSLSVQPETAVIGTVLDSAGSPAPAAWLVIEPRDLQRRISEYLSGLSNDEFLLFGASVQCNEHGEFQAVLPAGEYDVRVQTDTHQSEVLRTVLVDEAKSNLVVRLAE